MEHDELTIPLCTTPEEPPDLDRLGDQIAELSARIQAATYELLCYLHDFDRHYGWEGFRTCAPRRAAQRGLNWRTGLNLGAAREKLRVAHALAELNHLSAAMACGLLSYSKVRALTRIATPATEARLLALACCATAAQVERLVRAWRRADRAAQADGEQVLLASRTLSTRVDEDGMVVLRGRLTPEVGAVLLRALEAALEQVPGGGAEGAEVTLAQRRADALGLMAESALAGALDPGAAGDRFQVTVHVAAETLAGGSHISAATCRTGQAAAAVVPETEPVFAAAPRSAGQPAVAVVPETEPAFAAAPCRTGQAAAAATPDTDPVSAAAPCRTGHAAAAATPEPDPAAIQTPATGAPVSGTVGPEAVAWQPGAGPGGAGVEAASGVIEQAGGLHVSAATSRRIACDAGLVVAHHAANGEVLDVGRRTRTIPTPLRRALEVRDQHQCQFPACESRCCDAHHIRHWADGGETRLGNLALLCRFHHRAVHEEEFQVVVDGAGLVQFLRPDGEPLPAVPQPPALGGRAAGADGSGWPPPASASARIPPLPSGMANRSPRRQPSTRCGSHLPNPAPCPRRADQVRFPL